MAHKRGALPGCTAFMGAQHSTASMTASSGSLPHITSAPHDKFTSNGSTTSEARAEI